MNNSNQEYHNMSESQMPVSAPTNQKQQLARELQMQMDFKRQKELHDKQNERLQDIKLLFDQQQNRGGGGAPMRDEFGNVITSRRNPYNPNAQSVQWFGHAPSLNPQAQLALSQLQPPPRPLQQNQSMINLGSFKNEVNPNMNQSSLQAAPQFFQGIDDLQNQEKRMRAQLLQRELQSQIEMKQRQKEEEKLKEKRERELEEQRIERDRQEMERRLQEELLEGKLLARNLQETDLAGSKIKEQQRINMLKYQNELLEQQQMKYHSSNKKPKRIRTPVEEAEKRYQDEDEYNMRTKIEQRIIKELPIEVEKTVRDTVNVELHRLRAEMNLQTNNVAEQLILLKGQLMMSNEQKQQNEEQIRKLREELKQTQIVDEIRQRELYQAFLGQQKNPILEESTGRLMTPETVKFTFPKRPRPYYNMADPYLGANEEVNRDLHGIISDDSKLMPIYTHKDTNLYDQANVQDKMVYNESEMREDMKLGYRLDADVDLPEDYVNRQRLYIPKKYMESKVQSHYDIVKDGNMDLNLHDLQDEYLKDNYNRNYGNDIISIIGNTNEQHIVEESEIKDVIQRYEDKLEKLDEFDATRTTRTRMDQLDDALHDLISQQQGKIIKNEPYKAQFEYNDYYFPDYQESNFNNKLNSIYSK